MSEEKKGFTVKDRRLFTSQGELRSTDAAEPAVAEPTPAAPIAAPVPPPPEAISGPRVSSPGEVDFAAFLMSLAAQAGSLLEGDADLQGAREMISILEMLADKTEGRRSADETRVLQSLLFELRTAYVERARLARG